MSDSRLTCSVEPYDSSCSASMILDKSESVLLVRYEFDSGFSIYLDVHTQKYNNNKLFVAIYFQFCAPVSLWP